MIMCILVAFFINCLISNLYSLTYRISEDVVIHDCIFRACRELSRLFFVLDARIDADDLNVWITKHRFRVILEFSNSQLVGTATLEHFSFNFTTVT